MVSGRLFFASSLYGLLILAVTIDASNSAVAARLDIEVLVRPGGQSDHVVAPARLHRDGDIVLWNEEVRILVRPAGGERVVLSLIAPSGQSVALPVGGDGAAKPIVTEWIRFGDPTGISRIVARQGSASAQHVLVHVSRALAGTAVAAPVDVAGPVSGDAKERAGALVARLADDVRQADEPRWYRAALTGAEQAVATVRRRDGAKLYRNLAPGVVLVVAENSRGSGAIVTPQGAVLTNWHVVDGHETVGVAFLPPFGQTVRTADIYEARVVKVDMVADLALIQIISPPPSITVLRVGDIDDIQIGAEAHAIGHPLGEFWSYTRGVISQLRPDYEWEGSDDGIKHSATVLQTQTPLNPGNSGGPLFSSSEKIIGLNTFLKRGQGMGFAVAATELSRFLAAKESRLAARPPESSPERTPASGAPDEDCGKRAVGQRELDSKTVVAYDTNCNGKPDTFFVEDPGPPPSEYVLIDSDEDGSINRKVVFNVEGKFTLHVFYGGQDGAPTMYGYDYDNDGELDRFMKPS